MEWRYTATPQTLRRGITAQAKTPGTAARRAWVRGFAASVVLAAGIFVLMSARTATLPGSPLALLLTLALLFAVLWPLSLSPAAFARNQILALRLNGRLAAHCGPCAVFLTGAELRMTGGETGGGRADWRCPAAQLARAVAAEGGVLVVCQDGRALFLPPEAFTAHQSVPDCVRLFTQAIAAAQSAAAPDAPAPAAALPGWEPTPSGGILRFTLAEAQARALYRQLNLGVLRTAAYWRRQWWGWALMAAVCWLALLLVGWWLSAAVLLAVAGGMAWRMLYPAGLQNLLGPQMLTLTADGVYLTRESGHWSYPYTAYETLLETADGLFLYSGRTGAAQVLPKSAFADAAQLARCKALLTARLGRGEPG